MLGSSDQLALEITITITPEQWAALGPRDRVRLAQVIRQLDPGLVDALERKAAELASRFEQMPPQNPVEREMMTRLHPPPQTETAG